MIVPTDSAEPGRTPSGNPLPRRSLSVVTVVILIGNAVITSAILMGVFPGLREHWPVLAAAMLVVVGGLTWAVRRLARR
ncbi:MAG: hypothetical protein AAF488_03160 [Planctomycetota bacterium]